MMSGVSRSPTIGPEVPAPEVTVPGVTRPAVPRESRLAAHPPAIVAVTTKTMPY